MKEGQNTIVFHINRAVDFDFAAMPVTLFGEFSVIVSG
jgi:hypothetical protein